MLNFFSKSTQRQYELMRLLTASSDSIDAAQITQHLDCTERTLQSDIKNLSNSPIGNAFDFEIKSEKYKIILRNNISTDFFGHYFMNNNECFLLLEYVFFNNDHTVEELAEIHHFSIPTLYRLISRINAGFKNTYDLKFQTNPCHIVGDEVEVRSFYLQFFTEKYPFDEIVFKNINQDQLSNVFSQITKDFGFELQYSDYNMYELSLGVAYTRYIQGYYLPSNGPHLTESLDSIKKNNHYVTMINNVFNSDISVEVFNDNFSYLIRENIYFNYDDFLKNTYKNERAKNSFDTLNSIFSNISTTYNIPLTNREELIYKIHNSADLGIHNIDVRPLLIDSTYILIQQFKEQFPNFYNDLETKIINYLKTMNIDHAQSLVNSLLHKVFTRWENLYPSLEAAQRKIKIYVISSHDMYHAKLMARLLETELYYHADISIIDAFYIEDTVNNTADIDILVTNFTYLSDSVCTVAVNDIPTIENFQLIKEMIKKIHKTENLH